MFRPRSPADSPAFEPGAAAPDQGAIKLLLVGMGAVFWACAGAAGSMAAIAKGRADFTNTLLTIHNVGMWFSALCHFAGATLTVRWRAALRDPPLWLAAGYALALAAMVVLVLATLQGLLPIFFVPGQGATLVRKLVLLSTAAMLGVTGILFAEQRPSTPQTFAYWYGQALLFFAAGALALVLSVPGTPLGWAGRITLWEIGGDSLGLRGSENLATFLGYAPDRLPTLPDVLALVHPDERTELARTIRDTLEGKRDAYRFEWRIRARDGSWHWFHCQDKAFDRDAAGLARRLIGAYANIDERKNTEQALRDSERRLALALAASDSTVWEMDVATGIITGSEDLYAMYGYAPGELTSLADWAALVHDDDRAEIAGKVDEAIRGKTNGYSFETQVRCKDGTWRWNLTEALVAERDSQGRAVRVVGTHSNIDARKRVEESLRLERSRLQASIDNSPLLILVKDMESRVVLANQAIFDNLAMPPREKLIGSSLFEAFPPNVAEARWMIDLATMEKDAPIRTEERIRHRDGTWHTYMTMRFPVHDIETDELIGICAISADITERKAVEAEIQRLNADLERRVEERTAETEQSNEALLHSNMELQHFAHATAHDLQTPLRSIAGFTQLLQLEVLATGNERVKEYSSLVIDNTKRLQALIESLLAYTRLDAQGLPFETVDLRDVVDEVVSSLRVLIQETGAEISSSHLPRISVDRVQIAQVLQNLIENGIKYKRSSPPRVSLSADFQQDRWLFSVADNGIGIDPKHRERIFEVFRRLHTYHQVAGTGIGLALCRRIVERHGGRIWVESRPGEGSTFYFTLPVRNDGG